MVSIRQTRTERTTGNANVTSSFRKEPQPELLGVSSTPNMRSGTLKDGVNFTSLLNCTGKDWRTSVLSQHTNVCFQFSDTSLCFWLYVLKY